MAKQYTTINDIAHAAGVSKTTVSRYLNGHFERMSEQTRQKIAQIIEEAGYQANSQAQALSHRQSHLIGMVVADIENIFSSLLFKGADQVLAAADYSIMLMNANNSATLERRQLERLIKLRVDGVLLQPSLMNADAYQLLADAQVPTIIVDRKVTPAKWPQVVTDNQGYSKLLVDYAARQGFQQVVVLSEAINANSARLERLAGVQEAAKEHDLTVHQVEIAHDEPTGSIYAKLAQVPDWLNGRTVIYAFKGTLLTRLMETLAEFNVQIPKEVGVMAFDDWDWAKLMSPQITTIQQDPQQLGQVAAKNLLALLDHQEVPATTLVDSQIMVRKSL
ncbi:LacI family DNA-binding transcriptional regulator [Limosilactobacillus fermentum]|uniref:LacI family DNA-binding transcriptional regulator n=1 Tax=Limosilactobacillus fermentum TaxID=1613 RepID=UPI00227D85B2|nr:LacI family DNA-binding transcriptional regulator [Limosilactobacillus fermentum]